MWRHKVNTNFLPPTSGEHIAIIFIVNTIYFFVFAAEARSDGATAAIAGGVVGGLIGVVLIAVIVIVIVAVIILKNKQELSKYDGRSTSVFVCNV